MTRNVTRNGATRLMGDASQRSSSTRCGHAVKFAARLSFYIRCLGDELRVLADDFDPYPAHNRLRDADLKRPVVEASLSLYVRRWQRDGHRRERPAPETEVKPRKGD